MILLLILEDYISVITTGGLAKRSLVFTILRPITLTRCRDLGEWEEPQHTLKNDWLELQFARDIEKV